MDLGQQLFDMFLNIFSRDRYYLRHEARIPDIKGTATYRAIPPVSPPTSTAVLTEDSVHNNRKVDMTGQRRNFPTLSWPAIISDREPRRMGNG